MRERAYRVDQFAFGADVNNGDNRTSGVLDADVPRLERLWSGASKTWKLAKDSKYR